jgi:DNA helicase-2/ATP-dependent DNA helicase PcrA
MSNLLEGLNEQQLQAVTSTASTILTLAGAGSGKTTVLTKRIAHLHIEHRVGTTNMLCLTFSRLAAKEMKERIIKLIGEEQGKKLLIGTFHAFAVSVLKRWGHKIGIDENFTIYDQEDREEIIKKIIDEYGNKTNLKRVMDVYLFATSRTEEEDRVIKEYRYRCAQNNALDLDKLIYSVVLIWRSYPEALEEYQHNFTHLFVDEFQDTSADQMELISMLNAENIFIVGDDYQAIYGWRNARVEYILDFSKINPHCEVIKLEDNYRSTESIVKAANNLIAHNINRTDKKLIAHKSGAEIVICELEDPNTEAVNIATMIQSLHSKGTIYKDIAILTRTNTQVGYLQWVLEDKGIPVHRVAGKDDPYKTPAVRPIMNWMYFLYNRKDNIAFKKVYKSFGSSDLHIYELEVKSLESNISLYELAMQFGVAVFKEFMNEWHTAEFEYEINGPGSCFKILLDFLEITEEQKDIQRALESITMWEDQKKHLGELHTVQAFLKYLRYRDIQEKLIEERDAVKLMTVHASKGLEFDNVFIAGMNQDVFPSKRGDIEEERRLAYVAVTRAKNRLFITYPRLVKGWNGSLSTGKVSSFIAEMSQTL